MILGLTALGEGRMPWRTHFEMSGAHVVGGVVGGTLAAALLWLAATPIRTLVPTLVSAVLVASVAILALAVDAHIVRLRTTGVQVPAVWYQRYGPVRSYAMYGTMLGSAFATHRPYAAVYGIFLALSLFASFPAALLGGVAFGLGRTFLVAPASLRATAFSKLLYRSSAGHPVWRGVSMTLTGVLLAALLLAA